MISAKRIRHIILDQSFRAQVGHIGSALCVAEILAVIYRDLIQLQPECPAERDRFILSKGHAALALYAALFLKGVISQAELDSFLADGSLLGVHPDHGLSGVDFSTGSLGQGVGVGVGCALAAKLKQSNRKVYVVASDAEANEGSFWEAVMFAAKNRLDNLRLIIDDNAQQAFGYDREVLALGPLSTKLATFGFHVETVDGHNEQELLRALTPPANVGLPLACVAKTTFGKSVSFMEGALKWHYWPLSPAEYQQAKRELEANE